MKPRLLPLTMLVACGVAAGGQSTPPNELPQKLTLEAALALAGRNSPALASSAATTARARAATRTARAYLNPLVEIFEGKQSARPIATPGVPGFLQHYAAYQTVEIPAERRARQRVAELGTASGRLGEESSRRQVVAAVTHSFYNVLRNKEEVDHAEENERLVADLRRRVQVEVDVGEKGRLELTRAEAELARARFAIQSAQIGVVSAVAQLRAVIAAPATANLDPQGELEPAIKLDALPILRERALTVHPLLAQARTAVTQAEAALEHERTLRLPQPTFFAEYERQPDLSFWRAGVTVPLPIRDRREGQIAEAQASIRQSQSFLEQQRLLLNSALESAYEQYLLADQQVKSLESGSLLEAESAVNAAKAAYRFGERGIVEVLDAQRVLQSVRGDLLDAQYVRQGALIDLQELGAVAPGRRP